MTFYIFLSHAVSDAGAPREYMTNESKRYNYKPLNLLQSSQNRTMPTNTDPEMKLVVTSPELPKLKTPNLKVKHRRRTYWVRLHQS